MWWHGGTTLIPIPEPLSYWILLFHSNQSVNDITNRNDTFCVNTLIKQSFSLYPQSLHYMARKMFGLNRKKPTYIWLLFRPYKAQWVSWVPLSSGHYFHTMLTADDLGAQKKVGVNYFSFFQAVTKWIWLNLWISWLLVNIHFAKSAHSVLKTT